jgi:hypothetical protein
VVAPGRAAGEEDEAETGGGKVRREKGRARVDEEEESEHLFLFRVGFRFLPVFPSLSHFASHAGASLSCRKTVKPLPFQPPLPPPIHSPLCGGPARAPSHPRSGK